MRSLRHELFSTGVVLSLPVAICLAFPFESIGFKAARVPSECKASASFVNLSPEEEASALQAAKTSWQSDASAGQRMRIRLPLGELPDEPENPLREIKTSRLEARPAPLFGYRASSWAPSQRANPPARIPRRVETEVRLAFPREELLKLH